MQKKIYNHSKLVRLTTLTALAIALIGAALIGNSFRFTQEAVMIPGPKGTLAGVLTFPPKSRARGLVVMVHGDGPVDATQGGLYFPWFEGAADAGFATLSWSKPGIGGSEGNWLSQSMDDRAAEVIAALDWAQQNIDVPPGKIVLWGASQAGWVLPRVTRIRQDIGGVVAIAPAINWLRQGRFNLLAELDDTQASPPKRAIAIAQSDLIRALLKRGSSYDEYLASKPGPEPVSKERWSFIMHNFKADASDDLVSSASRKIPVHLMVGLHDRHVDVTETEKVYRSVFGPLLSVTHVDGAHSLARTIMEEHRLVGVLTAAFWPRSLLAPGAIVRYRLFLSELGQEQGVRSLSGWDDRWFHERCARTGG